MKLVIIDNYDSFTYNIFHYLEGHNQVKVVDVFKNDQVPMADLNNYDAILLSPGPGLPKDAGVLMEVIQSYWGKKPILGICLGMQALAEHTGGTLFNLPDILHGRSDILQNIHPKSDLFKNISNFQIGRYHSWAIQTPAPEPFIATSFSSDQVMMTMEAPALKIYGMQFHPESILSPQGKQMLYNFLDIITVN